MARRGASAAIFAWPRGVTPGTWPAINRRLNGQRAAGAKCKRSGGRTKQGKTVSLADIARDQLAASPSFPSKAGERAAAENRTARGLHCVYAITMRQAVAARPGCGAP
jgi:hypothetical protein